MEKKQMTLCFVRDGQSILLGMKKRGFGVGKWNGFGGKVNIGESIEAGARREMLEECGVQAAGLDRRGVLDFIYEPNEIHEVHIFAVTEFQGQPVETEEMQPKWFLPDEIPFSDMWPDDPYWLPLFLADKKFKGEFTFDRKKCLIGRNVEVVNN